MYNRSMDLETLKLAIYDLNADEKFYKNYSRARQDPQILDDFLHSLDPDDVEKRHLLILEWAQTIPIGQKYDDTFFFDLTDQNAIIVQRHNRYSPALVHSHTFFELIYVYDGKCIQKIGNHSFSLQMGDVCIIPPSVRHSIEADDDTSVIFNVMIRKETLHSIFFNFLSSNNVLSTFFLNNIYSQKSNSYILFHTGSDFEIKRGFLYMYWESINKDLYFYQMIANTLTLCFGLLIRNYSRYVEMPAAYNKTESQAEKILQEMQCNYKIVTIDSIASQFGYSEEYISKLIKNFTGKSFTKALQDIRMSKAEDLLVNTNMTIENISVSVGYSNMEHFIRLFKRIHDQTPTRYRKEHSNNKERAIIARI